MLRPSGRACFTSGSIYRKTDLFGTHQRNRNSGSEAREHECRPIQKIFIPRHWLITACRDRAPHKVTTWVRQLAGDFHGFYHDCYVMGEGISEELTQARLWLVEGARIGLAVGLGLLGVSAPDSM